MRYLIVSDIHGNLEALQAALQAAPFDKLLCLGDLVGYGANPNEVVELIRDLQPYAQVRGNHDKVVAGVHEGDNFVSHAQAAANWSRQQLTAENLEYLRSLPEGPIQIDPRITLAHGSPADEDQYILGEPEARASFSAFGTPLCFFGHSHISVIIAIQEEGPLFVKFPKHQEIFQLRPDTYTKHLVNPGSVGQPRDGDWHGAAAVLDMESQNLQFLRFEYDVASAQAKIRKAGLPEMLAVRLGRGR